jgi:hypothetical protein
MRLQNVLSGQWAFQLDPEGVLEESALQPDRKIPVPMPWQAAFPELSRYSGYAWYQHRFELSPDWMTGELLLHFGAVDYWCQVYVNGQYVGAHEGGYTPFRFPIRQYVQQGENRLSVRVYDTVQEAIVIPRWRDAPDAASAQPPFNPELIPHGKQTWYIDASGIWQDVKLTAVPAQYIDRVQITPDIHSGETHVRVMLGGAAQHSQKVRVVINAQTIEATAAAGQNDLTVTVNIPAPVLWTPDTPHLYTAEVSLFAEDGTDKVSERFGFREIMIRDGQLLLNGEPIYLLCALDQDLYPETIYTVPSDDFLRDQFEKAKQLGLNSLRCHIKPPDPRYLELADEMGLLIWAEIPSWRTFYPKTSIHPAALHLDDRVKARAEQTLREMIARDYNHPSLIIWTIINEDWGTALLLSAEDRAWAADMTDLCKALDPTRLVVDNSPCPAPWGLSVHVKSDLDDFHIYANIPEHAEQFEHFVEQFGLRPLWSYSNTGDAQRTGQEPIILSEFGNWAMPSLDQFNGAEADWFALGAWWSPFDGEPGYAAGVLQRFDALGLRALWPDYEAFATASQWHGFHALKFEIEAMRRQPGIQGYVITELSDIYWESNGLLDFARNPKVFHERFSEFNAADVIIPQLKRHAYWDDEIAKLGLYLSHYSQHDWSQVRVTLSNDGEQLAETILEGVQRAEVRRVGRLKWRMPKTENPRPTTLSFEAESSETRIKNEVSVLLLPAHQRQAAYSGAVSVLLQPERSGMFADLAPSSTASPSGGLQNLWGEEDSALSTPYKIFGQLGYQTHNALNAETRLLITDHPDTEMLRWVRDGGDMLYLCSTPGSPFFWWQSRGGTYSGNWITSFSWLRPEIHPRLNVSNPLSLPFTDIIPVGVILGLPVTDAAVQGDFLGGQFSGWLHHPALHTVQFRFGKGRVIMTTYRIKETLHYHPIAAAMLHDLVDHLTSAACHPVLKANYG